MIDVIQESVDWFVLAILVVPILYALASGLKLWWGRASRPETSRDPGPDAAEVEALGLVRAGTARRLRLKNTGAEAARRVHVYVNNRPVTDFRGRASAEGHPIPVLGGGEERSYRLAAGSAMQGPRALVRIEWEDEAGEQVRESVVTEP